MYVFITTGNSRFKLCFIKFEYLTTMEQSSNMNKMTAPLSVTLISIFRMHLRTCMGTTQHNDYLRSSFTIASNIHARMLRSSSNFQLYTPKPHSKIYRNTFVFSVSSVCNSLPSYIHNSNSVQNVKAQYLRWVNPNDQRHVWRISRYPEYNVCVCVCVYIYIVSWLLIVIVWGPYGTLTCCQMSGLLK